MKNIYSSTTKILIWGGFCLALLFCISLPAAPAKAVTGGTLSGYAWSSTIGWIHLRGATYGVNTDSAGTLSGYAWSSNVGWISFGTSGCPSGTCTAKVDQTTGAVSGWAKAITATGSGDWDGWIHLSGSGYGFTAGAKDGSGNCTWSGYAWGGGPDMASDVIGWVNSKGTNYGITGTGTACSNSSLTVSCSATPNSGTVNSTNFTWQVTGVDGGTGPYTYVWHGSESLEGKTTATVSNLKYTSTGIKTGTVNVTETATGKTGTGSCGSVTVNDITNLSCSSTLHTDVNGNGNIDAGDTVRFSASPSDLGGTAYTWKLDAGTSDANQPSYYDKILSDGPHTALVSASGHGSDTCSLTVGVCTPDVNGDLSATPDRVKPNDHTTLEWTGVSGVQDGANCFIRYNSTDTSTLDTVSACGIADGSWQTPDLKTQTTFSLYCGADFVDSAVVDVVPNIELF